MGQIKALVPTETDNRWDFQKNLNDIGGDIPGKLRNKRRKSLGSILLSVERYLPQETVCLTATTFPLGSLEGATKTRH